MSTKPGRTSLFPEWEAEHLAEAETLPKRILEMHAFHGKAEGHFCGTCQDFQRHKRSTSWFKCGRSRITGGAATDWRARWPACGLWRKERKNATEPHD